MLLINAFDKTKFMQGCKANERAGQESYKVDEADIAKAAAAIRNNSL